MSQPTRQSKSPYVVFGAGIALGAVAMSGVMGGSGIRAAFAQNPARARTISATSAENLATLHGLDESYRNLAAFTGPAVVQIRASTDGSHKNADGSRMPVMAGSGSGFIFRPDGYIITNDHVVGGFDKVVVDLKDGRSLDGKVIRAEDSDIAIVKVDAKELPTLEMADSAKVQAGQIVMAVGAPFGLDQSVTFGHVSAIGRMQGIQDRLYPDLIQTDAAINVGNSGGPLVNVDGQVVGVNTAIFTTTGGSAGVGFAIPANQARFIAETLISKGKLTRAMLGVVPANLKDIEKQQLKMDAGAKVDDVSSDGPAAAAGIQKGDVIVKIGTTAVRNQMDVRNAMLVYAPGTTVPVELVRGGRHLTIDVKLIEYKRPAMQNAPRDFSLPDGSPNNEDLNKRFKEFFDKMPKEFQDNGFDNKSDDRDVPALGTQGPRLGVSIAKLTDATRKEYSIPSTAKGTLVVSVEANSVAARAGLKVGDVITHFDGKALETPEALTAAVQKVKAGEKHRVRSIRYRKGGVAILDQTVNFK